MILAAISGCCPIVSILLLKRGADLHLKNKEGKTATQISLKENKRTYFLLKHIYHGQ